MPAFGRRRAKRGLLLEDPNDVAIAAHHVDAVKSLPESHAILSVTRYDGVSEHLETSLGVDASMEVSTTFAFEPLSPDPQAF